MNHRALLYLLLLFFFVFSCGTENETTYTLTTTVSPSEGGTVSPSEGEFTEGEQITLTGTPTDDGWVFSRWEGDWSSSSNPTTILMDRNKILVGVFERRDYPLNITIEGEGTVTETIVSQPTTEYSYETIVELTPNPSEGWEFVEWGGDLEGSEVPQLIIVNQQKNVTALFKLKIYELSIQINGEGSVSIDPNQSTFHHGEIADLSATPSSGWYFDGWSGDVLSTENPINIEFNQYISLSANFKQILHEVNINIEGSGTVSSNPAPMNDYLFPEGSEVQFMASPINGWEFTEWTGDLGRINQNPITLKIDSSFALNVKFDRMLFTIDIQKTGAGTLEVSPDSENNKYPFNTEIRINAIPDENWIFESWSGNVSGNINPLVMIISGNTSIVGNFVVRQPEFGNVEISDVRTTTANLKTSIVYLGLHNIENAGFCLYINNIETCQSGILNGTNLELGLINLEAKSRITVRPFLDSQKGRFYGNPTEFRTSFFEPGPSYYDADFNVYNTIIINGQTWMRENLRSTTFLDGSSISGWSYPDNNPANNPTHGKLYPKSEIFSGKNPCPFGFRLPTNEDWVKLIQFAESGWNMKHTGWDFGQSTNLSGFTGLPSGNSENGTRRNFGTNAFWWSTTGKNIVNLTRGLGVVNRFNVGVWSASVRCIGDNL